MEYTICELTALSGVTARTLRWYDQLGLLPPARIAENGYRVYSEASIDRLQQILFYRALNVPLKQIGAILDSPDFNAAVALEAHLKKLQAEKRRIDQLIHTVQKTIDSQKGIQPMSNQEKFEGFQKDLIDQNERQYGKEIREKYGDEAVNASNRNLMGMTEDAYRDMEALGKDILAALTAAVQSGASPDSEAGARIAQMHKTWLTQAWGNQKGAPEYSPALHLNLAEMYVADDRFRKFYDAETEGCAQFLRDAVRAF